MEIRSFDTLPLNAGLKRDLRSDLAGGAFSVWGAVVAGGSAVGVAIARRI